MSITIRELHTTAEFAALVELEMHIWQMDGRGAVPENIMQAIAHTGGSVVGAYDDDLMIGFALAFLAREDGSIYPWSHMAGVHPAYQAQGVGFQLKQAQRAWALEQGYTRMGWTFDPLQRRNANFNLRHLGACAVIYHANFYGEMTDGINAGVPSDRLQILWQLDAPRTSAHAAGQIAPALPEADVQASPLLLEVPSPDELVNHLANWHAPVYRVEVPYDAPALKQTDRDMLLRWQLALRHALQSAFEHGYVAVDFEVDKDVQRCWYVLQQKEGA